MAPTTRAGARRTLFVDESTAHELSDACSRTNEDNGRARRKRRRSPDVFSFTYEQDVILRRRMSKFSAMFACIFSVVMFMFAYGVPLEKMFTYGEEGEEEDDDVSTEEEEEEEDVSTEEEDEDDVCTDIQEEEDDTYLDADLLECSLDCLKSLKARIDHELGPDNVICDEVIDIFAQCMGIDQHELSSAHEMFASKDRKFRSLMALPMDMRRAWLLIHIRKL